MRALCLLLAVTAACDAYDTDLGPAPYLCGPDEPRCPTGYTCMDDPASGAEVCVASDDSIGNVECDDDSQHEPNDLLAEAKPTPVDTMKDFTLEGLAVCPAGDEDYFAFTLSTANQKVELVLVYEAGGSSLRGELLNSGGIPIETATQVPNMPGTVSASAQNLPGGMYYVKVSSASSVNNYKFSLAVTSP